MQLPVEGEVPVEVWLYLQLNATDYNELLKISICRCLNGMVRISCGYTIEYDYEQYLDRHIVVIGIC